MGYPTTIVNDSNKNLLLCLCKQSSTVVYIQLDSKQEKKSRVLDTIPNIYEPLERKTKLKWLSRMNCYVEATDKGKIRFCDLNSTESAVGSSPRKQPARATDG